MKTNTTNNCRQLSIDFSNPDIPEESRSEFINDSIDSDDENSDELFITESIPAQEPLRYICFGSGSSGNCCYIGTRKGGIMIDSGVRPEFIEQAMQKNDIHPSQVKAVLLTHDHSDHVRFVYKMMRQLKSARLFCTNRVLNGLLRRHNVSRLIRDYHEPIFKEIPFKILDFEITAFEVPHDGSDNMGFFISYAGKNFAVATDLGAVTERAAHYMSLANYLMIEANYDSRMLANGPYPAYLKARIRTENGHLDNADTAKFLSEIAPRGTLSHIFLCHLSKDNNTPETALRTIGESLGKCGLKVGDGSESITDRESDIHLMALPRFDTTRLIILK